VSSSDGTDITINSSVLDEGVQLSTLAKVRVVAQDSGSYMCAVGTNPTYSVDVFVIDGEISYDFVAVVLNILNITGCKSHFVL